MMHRSGYGGRGETEGMDMAASEDGGEAPTMDDAMAAMASAMDMMRQAMEGHMGGGMGAKPPLPQVSRKSLAMPGL